MDRLAATLRAAVDDELVGLLERYLPIACLSPDFVPGHGSTPEIEEAIDLFAAWAAARPLEGATVTVQRLPGRTPALVVDVPATSTEPTGTVLLYGHLDKQPPLGSWSDGLDPFTAVRRGDLLFGRGAADDGYALPTALLAIEAIDAAGLARGRASCSSRPPKSLGAPTSPPTSTSCSPRPTAWTSWSASIQGPSTTTASGSPPRCGAT